MVLSPRRPLRVALVVTSLGVGGAEKAVVSLADDLSALGHEVLLCYLTGELEMRPADPRVRVVSLRMRSGAALFPAYVRLRGLLRAFQPDVVHAHLYHAILLTRLLRLTTSVPRVLSTAHSRIAGNRLRVLAYRLTNALADITTNVSHEATGEFVARKVIAADRIRTVHNGIATDAYRRNPAARERIAAELALPANARILVSVGRLSTPKDYPNLLRALRHLKDQGEARFVSLVAGEGSLRGELESLAQSLGLRDKVRFLGVRHDIPDLLSAADVFVLSSAWEGLPMVVGEAMAAECYVVATDCGGVHEFLGELGSIAPPRDPVALAAAIRTALTCDDAERRRIGSLARARVEKLFAVRSCTLNWLKLYEPEPMRAQETC